MKIALVVATRPDIIKMSPIIKHCYKKKLDFFVIHTGQHYSPNLSKIFFEELELPTPKYNLHIKSSAPWKQGEHASKVLVAIENIMLKEKPDIAIVYGDTNSTLAAALATNKISTTRDYTGRLIRLGHVEAGLRSYDRAMPEEINRVVVDHLSDCLFAPTELAKKNAMKEGIDKNRIFVTGNTIVDAVLENIKIANKRKDILKKLNLTSDNYFLVTAHRQESVDVKKRLTGILKGLQLVYEQYKLPIVYPMHPRTMKMIKRFKMTIPKCIRVVEPLGYLEFLQLEAHAKLVLTDSGGLQEESCILAVPCVTLRNNTERPETVTVGSNVIAGYEPKDILSAVKTMLDKKRKWVIPFGDGTAAKKIMRVLV